MSNLFKQEISLQEFFDILHPIRFSALIILVVSYALIANDQFQDMLVGLEGYKWYLFVFSVIWWALQSWGWARWALDHRTEQGWGWWALDYQPEKEKDGYSAIDRSKSVYEEHLPRLLGCSAFVLSACAAWTSGQKVMAVLLILVGSAVYYFLVIRQKSKNLTKFVSKPKYNKIYSRFTWSLLIIAIFLTLWNPVSVGQWFGAGAVMVFGLGCLIPVGTVVVSLGRKNRMPIIFFLFLAAILFSRFNDNHEVRTLSNYPIASQYKLNEALEEWYEQVPKTEKGQANMVFIASAGGGLRASFWTTAVLSQVKRVYNKIDQHIFAISGVSGGALGSVFFNATLAEAERNKKIKDKHEFSKALRNVVGQDYLAPVVAGLIFSDLMQRFFPFGIFPDRAKAIEMGWEAGFKHEFSQTKCGMNSGFRSLWTTKCRGQHWLPLLFINGTHQETGRRIITTPLAIDDFKGIFPNSMDFFKLHGQRPIRLSTAAHNAARFTYISPAGTLKNEGDKNGHIIDGGYFENYGAITLNDLLKGIIKTEFYNTHKEKINFVVIQISNDVNLKREVLEGNVKNDRWSHHMWMNETLAPIRGLLSTRVGRGELAVRHLQRYVEEVLKSKFYLFHLQGQDEDEKESGIKDVYFPLGWVLSEESQVAMMEQVCSYRDSKNASTFRSFVKKFHHFSNQGDSLVCPSIQPF